MTPAGRLSRHSSWTVRRCSCRSCTRSSARWRRPSVCASSRRRCRRARACRSRRCRSSRPRSTRSSAAGWSCSCPEDADARDLAEAARWFLGPERVALPAEPRRALGVRPRRRRRTSSASVRARSTCSRRAGSSARRRPRSPSRSRRATSGPSRSAIAVGDEPGVEGLAEELALAGYERVERVEDRGQFAVRGGLVDVFPTTGREPLRVELFGDEIEQVRAFSPFTQRALHPVDDARRLSGRRAAGSMRSIRVHARTRARRRRSPTTSSPSLDRRARPRLGARSRCGASGSRSSAATTSTSTARPSSTRSRGAAVLRSRRRSPAIAARGLAEAENELSGLVARGQPRRRRVPAPRARRCARRTCCGGRRARARGGRGAPDGARARVRRRARAARLRLARPRARAAARHAGLPQARRRAPPRACGRALQSFADLRTGDYVVHEDHGVGKLLGFETKTVAGVTRDYLFLAFRGDDRLYVPHEQIGKVSRYIGADAKAPALSKLGGKAWDRLKARAREGVRELAGELIRLYAERAAGAGRRVLARARVARAARGRVPVPRDRGPAARDRGGQGGPRGAAPDGPARLRRRRLRQDRGRDPRGVRGRGERQADAHARADDDPRRAALEHVPRPLPRLPGARRDGLAIPEPLPRRSGCSPISARARSTS